MGLKILDAEGREITLSTRQPVTSREVGSGNDIGSATSGVLNQTEVQALPFVIEEAILKLSSLINTINSQKSFQTSVSRVSNPNSIFTGKKTFTTENTTQRLSGISIPNTEEGKTMAYCDIKASSQNEGPLYVGSSDNNISSDNGRELDPGEPMTITIDDISKIGIFSSNAGNSFSFIVYYEG